MVRMAATAVVSLIANAIALVVAALVLGEERMEIHLNGFIIAVLIFTAVAVVVEPLVRQIAIKNAPAILGSSALIATLLSLIITGFIGDALEMSGLSSWVLATVIVWIVALASRMLLPFVIFKKILREVGSNSGQ